MATADNLPKAKTVILTLVVGKTHKESLL